MTRTFLLACLAIIVGVATASAGIVTDTLTMTQAGIVSIVASFVVGTIAGFVSRITKARTDAARAKAVAERSLADKAALQIEKRLTAENIALLEHYLADFIAARLPSIAAPAGAILDPLKKADDMFEDAVEGWVRRNPDTARAMNIDVQSFKEKLAGQIGKAVRGDSLAAELSKILPGVVRQ